MIYSEYILSPEWKAKRLEALTFHGPHCAVCGTEHRLEVHHLTYERMGFELMSDLQILCRYHHEDVHRPEREAIQAQREFERKAWLEMLAADEARANSSRPSKFMLKERRKERRKTRFTAEGGREEHLRRSARRKAHETPELLADQAAHKKSRNARLKARKARKTQ